MHQNAPPLSPEGLQSGPLGPLGAFVVEAGQSYLTEEVAAAVELGLTSSSVNLRETLHPRLGMREGM